MMRRTCNILSLGVMDSSYTEYDLEMERMARQRQHHNNNPAFDSFDHENGIDNASSSSSNSSTLKKSEREPRSSRLLEWLKLSRQQNKKSSMSVGQSTVDVEESSTNSAPPIPLTLSSSSTGNNKAENVLPTIESSVECSLSPNSSSTKIVSDEAFEDEVVVVKNDHSANNESVTMKNKTNESSTLRQQQIRQKDEEILAKFLTILQQDDLTTLEQVNLLYALGRMSAKLGHYKEALEYHQAELELTLEIAEKEKAKARRGGDDFDEEDLCCSSSTSAECWVLFSDPDAVPKVLDGMAKIAKNGLNDSQAALDYYQEALKLRTAVYRTTVDESYDHCTECGNSGALLERRDSASTRGTSLRSSTTSNASNNNNKPKHRHPSVRPVCPRHKRALKEASQAVEETRQNIGRILFEQGKVDQAVQMIPSLVT